MTSNLIGQMLGQYYIDSEIGTGGMATVYRAYQASIDRYVAIKVLDPTLADDPNFVIRFEKEAKAVAALEHPHILPVYDFGYDDELIFMVMRYIEGGTLSDLLSQQQILPNERIVKIVSDVAQALDYAHSQGLVHRDVKPSNIMIDKHGEALLTDFGLVRAIWSNHKERLTEAGVVYGTPDYMSPEQALDKPLDGRCDIYALGVILYELLTGALPYKATTPMALALKHIKDPIPAPRNLNETISPDMQDVVFTAMAKKPESRYQTATEMAQVINLIVYGTKTVKLTQIPPEQDSTPLPIQWSNGQYIGVIVAVLLIILSAYGFGYVTNNPANPTQEENALSITPTRGQTIIEETFDDNRANWAVGQRNGLIRTYEATIIDQHYQLSVIDVEPDSTFFHREITEAQQAKVRLFLEELGQNPNDWLAGNIIRNLDKFQKLVEAQTVFTADILQDLTLSNFTLSADVRLWPQDTSFVHGIALQDELNSCLLTLNSQGHYSVFMEVAGERVFKSGDIPEFELEPYHELIIQVARPNIHFFVDGLDVASNPLDDEGFQQFSVGFTVQRVNFRGTESTADFDNLLITQP